MEMPISAPIPNSAPSVNRVDAFQYKVKHLHPDTLRGKDLPGEVIETVGNQMARVNAAWAAIKRERFS